MNTDRLQRLPSYRELQAKKAAEELAQRNRQGLAMPCEVAHFNGPGWDIVDPNPPKAKEPKPTKTPRFRKGDRLVCIGSWNVWLTKGKVYTAIEDSDGCVFVKDNDGDIIGCSATRFRAAEELAHKETH